MGWRGASHSDLLDCVRSALSPPAGFAGTATGVGVTTTTGGSAAGQHVVVVAVDAAGAIQQVRP